ncbi:MAG: TPM domain-containing protein [Erythrobacter sp.]
MKRLALFIAALAALLAAPAAAQPAFPELTGRVVDQADIIPADQEAQLVAALEALETQSQRQLVIATVDSLEGYEIADYGYQLGRAWGLGDAERNDGALLLVAPNERRVRIEAGYGLEGYLTDALSALIIQNQILPRFREGDFPGGITAGTAAIIAQLQLPPDEAARVAQQAGAQQQTQTQKGGFPVGALVLLIVLFIFFILPLIRGGRRRKYRATGDGPWGKRGDTGRRGRGFGDTARDIILWEVGSAIVRGALSGGDDWGGGGGFGGGFGGGGGFSGGGGSFGGGGASGGW